MIIVKNNKEKIFDFNYWLEHKLTFYDIEKILNNESIDKEQQKFKIEYQKLQMIEEPKELWFSLKEAAYILNGYSFLNYAESDDKDERSFNIDYVKNKSNEILKNVDILLSDRKNDSIKQYGTKGLESYSHNIKPQKKKFISSKMKHVNTRMIDEMLRDNTTKLEKLNSGNIAIEEVLPSKEEIKKYINYDNHLKNNDRVLEYLNNISTKLGKALFNSSNFLNKISFLKTMVKEVRKNVQNIHSDFSSDIQSKYESIKSEYIKLLKMCQEFSNDYVDILDIEHIFNIYVDVRIISNDADDANIINISYINNEQHITKNFKNFVDTRKKQYLAEVDWSRHYIFKNLNKIEEHPTTFLNGTMEIARISDWMYRNKTKVAYQLINQNFNDAYDLLQGMLKNEYSNLIRLLKSYYDWNLRL
ncbi:hypothetical protein K4T66_07015 [Staphylococcus epidermidis]|nr:hypothetical protein [Staphylococcus epidermidis]